MVDNVGDNVVVFVVDNMEGNAVGNISQNLAGGKGGNNVEIVVKSIVDKVMASELDNVGYKFVASCAVDVGVW